MISEQNISTLLVYAYVKVSGDGSVLTSYSDGEDTIGVINSTITYRQMPFNWSQTIIEELQSFNEHINIIRSDLQNSGITLSLTKKLANTIAEFVLFLYKECFFKEFSQSLQIKAILYFTEFIVQIFYDDGWWETKDLDSNQIDEFCQFLGQCEKAQLSAWLADHFSTAKKPSIYERLVSQFDRTQ